MEPPWFHKQISVMTEQLILKTLYCQNIEVQTSSKGFIFTF